MRATRILGLGLALVAAGGEARADLKMTPAPLLGSGAVVSDGWVPFAVRLESTEKAPVKATLRASPTGGLPGQRSEALVTLLPGASSVVRLPVRLAGAWSVQFQLVSEGGKELASDSVRTGGRNAPLLFDMQAPARLSASLQGIRVPVGYSPDGSHGSRAPQIQVSPAWADPASGDLVLPQRAAEWMAATAVVAPSDVLARLGSGDLEALGDFVLAGGTLAVVVKRPEDLRQGFLPAVLGGPLREAGPAAHLRRFFSDAPEGDGASSKGEAQDDLPLPPKGGQVAPGKAVSEKLTAYAGGALQPSDFGASAPYGLGEVHLLAFDPSKAPEIDDPWVKSRLVELTRHAWDRRAFLAMPQGGAGRSEASSLNVLQRQLDPNESARWGLILAAVLLVVYAVGAGPVNFLLAARAGKPLRALLLLPAMAGATFVAIVGLAVASKGWRGEARRLSLIEASGGMSRGSIRRYRGFFSASSQKASVRATGERGAPVLLGEGGEEGTLHVERSGLELRGVEVLPWQTVVVREDDMVTLGGGVSLTRAGGNDVAVTNRLGRDLRGLIVRVPDRDLYYLPALRDGASALASSGEPLRAGAPGKSPSGPSFHVTNAHLSSFTSKLNQASRGLGDAWEALHTVSDGWHIDWWPEGQPALLAQVDGGEGASSDQGLRLTRERLLLRVVGYGGAP